LTGEIEVLTDATLLTEKSGQPAATDSNVLAAYGLLSTVLSYPKTLSAKNA
jgi:hypothetical protein